MTTTRRLSAVLVADIVGYSRLMGQDDIGTLRAVKARRSEIIARHCHEKLFLAEQALVVEPSYAVAVAACHCSVAFALKRRSVRREMR